MIPYLEIPWCGMKDTLEYKTHCPKVSTSDSAWQKLASKNGSKRGEMVSG